MSELERMGVAVQRQLLSSSTSLNGMELSSGETTRLTLTLPRDTAIRAKFTREGFGAKVTKIFKKEIQTGDATFDDAIYIATDTPDATKAFLDNEAVRGAIATCVIGSGSVEIAGASVTLEVPGHDAGDPAEALVVVRRLLA